MTLDATQYPPHSLTIAHSLPRKQPSAKMEERKRSSEADLENGPPLKRQATMSNGAEDKADLPKIGVPPWQVELDVSISGSSLRALLSRRACAIWGYSY
jgi:hypothetical protein